MTTSLIRGNALALPFAAGTIDLILTSPPYFGLRSYTDAGEHYDGQIGSEPTPAEFLDALIAATAEMVRVLKPSGSIWVNLGDKYSGGTSGDRNTNMNERMGNSPGRRAQERSQPARTRPVAGARPKSLLGLPWRYAIRCIDELGLILRAEVIWSKPNGLPESVTDRVRRSHEQWFHFTKEPRYFAAVDHIREPHAQRTIDQADIDSRSSRHLPRAATGHAKWSMPDKGGRIPPFTPAPNPLGKLPGSVWSVPTQPLTVPPSLGVDHFAAFPMEWPRRIIQGWSPTGICTECGEGRRPIVHRGPQPPEPDRAAHRLEPGKAGNGHIGFRASKLSGQEWNAWRAAHPDSITGEQCGCPEPTAPTRPAVVLDPFGGTGTTAIVANALGRHGVSLDMSADYLRIANWRANDPGERAKAAGVDRPPAIPDGMDSLW